MTEHKRLKREIKQQESFYMSDVFITNIMEIRITH